MTASPPTESATRPDAEPAGLGQRFWALVADWLLCLLLAGGLTRLGMLPDPEALWPSVILVVEYAVFLGFFTQTPGMRLLRIHCVSIRHGRAIGLPRALVRGVLLALVLPALPAFYEPRRRGLHDVLGDSIVLREPPRS
ncbi:putative RDD family membrane protein YckC [Stackebrandtia albiflava]|uniref:Putative RDD family membrane protein YckC n=1 Tax=Stackebrandtia albiflava TaxID=406432 RepID=A0A562UQI4_9ACTN|nr:RDD family protein [Stackebrandtia albiflava]TWJ07879.1 putative RDD family membrane protein YckC [Stackebrandtia albiflava]